MKYYATTEEHGHWYQMDADTLVIAKIEAKRLFSKNHSGIALMIVEVPDDTKVTELNKFKPHVSRLEKGAGWQAPEVEDESSPEN